MFKIIIKSKAEKRWVFKLLIVVLLSMSIYVVNRYYLKYLNLPYIGNILKNHLNDFIGGFVFSAYSNLVIVLSGREPIKKLSALMVLMLVASIMWEYVFPAIIKYSTSDIIDVCSYLLGALLYYFVMNKDNKTICKY